MRTLVTAALLASACSGAGGVEFDLNVSVANNDVSRSCTEEAAPVALGEAVAALRVTVQIDDQFGCNQRLEVSGSSGKFLIPAETGRVRLFLEGFDPDDLLIAFGTAEVPSIADPSDAEIVMWGVNRFSCLHDRRMVHNRAFHSATLLRTGEVLFLGGIDETQEKSMAGAPRFGQVSTVEVYDPRTGEFREVEDLGDIGLQPRAFHTAHIVGPSEGGTGQSVLIVGGITNTSGDLLLGYDVTADATGRRVNPTSSATVAQPALAEISMVPCEGEAYREGEECTIGYQVIPAGACPDGCLARDFHASAEIRGDIVVAGGDALSLTGTATEVFEETGTRRRTTTPRPDRRTGATLTPLDDVLFHFGGNITDTGARTTAEILEVREDIVTSFQFVQLETLSPALGKPTAFHTAQPFDGGVVVFGGFAIDSSGILVGPVAGTVARTFEVTQSETLPTIGAEALANPTTKGALDFLPVGYPESVALPNGRVLFAGGSPDRNQCDAVSGAFQSTSHCSVDQAVSIRPGSTQLFLEPRMFDSRFGHAMTLLQDGSVLVTGGIHQDTRETQLPPNEQRKQAAGREILGSAEIYLPHPGDPFGRSSPQDLREGDGEICARR